MTNYEGIIRMMPDELETFLEQVHLRGLITGGYAVRMGFDWELEANPFHAAWLAETAEPAVDGSNAPYLKALSDAFSTLPYGKTHPSPDSCLPLLVERRPFCGEQWHPHSPVSSPRLE